MKILSLHISGFGKLSNFDLNFDQKLSVILEDNGWGKSTLANFIKAMFYSLPVTKTKTLDSNPRKKYKPWDNSVFGGTLTFENDGKIYKIERSFGLSESEDTFYLFDAKTNKATNDFSKDIGKELFGIDADTFSRTTYLPQLDLKPELTNNMSAKLNHMIEDSSDLISFNNAKTILDNARKIYIKTGERGKLFEKQKELENIEKQIQMLSNINENVETLNQKIESNAKTIQDLEQEEQQLSEKINVASTREKQQLENATFEKLSQEIQSNQSALDEINKTLKNTPPTSDELDAMRQNAILATEIEQNLKNENKSQEKLTQEKSEIMTFFHDLEPSKEQTQDINIKYQELISHQNKNQDVIVQTYQTNKKTPLIVTGLGFGLIAVMVALFIANVVSLVPFVIVSATILLSVFATIFLTKHKEQIHSVDKNKTVSLENELNALLQYDFDQITDINTKMYLFRTNISKLEEINNLINNQNSILEEMNKKYVNITQKISNFLQFYFGKDTNSSYFELLSDLANMCFQYSNLVKSIDSIKKQLSNLNPKEIENNDDQSTGELIKQKQSVTNNLQSLRQSQLELKTTLNNYLLQAEELEDLEIQKSNCEEEITKINHKIKILKNTDAMLDGAKDELDSMFLDPIATTFRELSTSLNASELESFKIDTDLNIMIEHNGQTKELSYLSRGYQDIAYIIARIACVKSMFKDTMPFVILDDPFVNLDSSKLKLAKAMLEELSKTYQIIYLVCHDSRK